MKLPAPPGRNLNCRRFHKLFSVLSGARTTKSRRAQNLASFWLFIIDFSELIGKEKREEEEFFHSRGIFGKEENTSSRLVFHRARIYKKNEEKLRVGGVGWLLYDEGITHTQLMIWARVQHKLKLSVCYVLGAGSCCWREPSMDSNLISSLSLSQSRPYFNNSPPEW